MVLKLHSAVAALRGAIIEAAVAAWAPLPLQLCLIIRLTDPDAAETPAERRAYADKAIAVVVIIVGVIRI